LRLPRTKVAVVVAAMLFITPVYAQEHAGHGGQHDHAQAAGVPLYDNLGNHHRAIDTDVDLAQAYFDQGLRLQYAFNHAEAIRAYEEALRHDPQCAMCWWGIALASGPNINAPMDEVSGQRAWEAIERARDLAAGGPAGERDLIGALGQRYAADPAAERAPLDAAYAASMEELAQRYPQDADVLALYGASRMNLNPWNYWSGDYDNRTPNEGTPEILEALSTAVQIAPENPGACHYYIHAVEAAYPERAVECADRLAQLMPGAGHIVHMPGHIYIRVGRYADAVRANEHAVHADESYIADQAPIGLYPSAYYPHNYHFMWFAASMAGMSDKAMEAALIVAPKVPVEVAKEIYWVQTVTVLPQLTAITFGDWDAALAAPAPPEDLVVATALHAFARGVAQAATDDLDGARASLALVREIDGRVRTDGPASAVSTSPAPTLTGIAVHMLAGEIALRSGDAAVAADHFRAAAAIEDEMLYDEPPLWFFPVRHSLGRALLEAGDAAAAEAAYRQDLARFRENGWSLYGLALALEAQGKAEEAAAVRARFEEAWADADVRLRWSRF
jgi:tetratricopeptide (TPR) repeat protein